MHNRIKIRRRGKRKYYAIEIPQTLRRIGEARTEVMATAREEVLRKYDREVAARQSKLDHDAGKVTLGHFLTKQFLEYYKTEGGVEPQTLADYRLHIETHIVPLIGDVRLARLTTRNVDEFLQALRSKISERTKKSLSDRTIEYSYAVLRRALQFAVDWNFIAANPASSRMRAAKRRRKVSPTKVRFLSPDQAKKLLEVVLGDRHAALYILALTTGMRQGELCGLKWSDVNLEGAKLTVNHSLAHTKRKKGEVGERVMLKGPKTTGSRRTIELPEVAVTALRSHAKQQAEWRVLAEDAWKGDDFVFTTRRGTPLDRGNALHRFQQICKRTELPQIRFYDLRHTHASLLIAEGVHPKKIAERLGHSSIKLTMDTYGHLFDGSDRESAARMDRLFGEKKPAPHPNGDGEQKPRKGKLIVMPKKAS